MSKLSLNLVCYRRAARKELGARRASFLADRPTKSTHKEQKILSIWLDFSPFCLQWKSRQSVLSSLAGFEWEAVFRRVDPELVLFVFPALHTLVLTTMGSRTTPRLGGDECQPTTEIHHLQIFICMCLWFWTGVVWREWLLGRNLHDAGVHGPGCPLATPTFHTDSCGENFRQQSIKIQNNWSEVSCFAMSSNVKVDVSGLLGVGSPPRQNIGNHHGTWRQCYSHSSTQKYKSMCLL